MSTLLNDIGIGTNAASDLLGGFASYAAGGASADQLKATAARARVATNLKLVQQERQGFMLQSKAQAAIGAQGWSAESGSAADILRSNAANLALDHGIIQMQGSELESKYLTAASAAKKSGMGGLLGGVLGAVGTVVGGIYGGPAGAALGGKLGGSLGGAIGGS
jgi:hypothetical protein